MSATVQTIIIKSVSFCNLACTYCSAHCGEHIRQQVRPESVLTVFNELLEAGRIAPACKVLWHGGEPSLYDPQKADFIMSELALLGKKRCVKFDFSMQTNGFSISPAWMRLIRKYRIGIGISCDGPEAVHDLCRKTATETGSYKNVMETIQTFSKMKIPVSLLSVIDRRQAGHADSFYQWAAAQNRPIKLNPLFSENMGHADLEGYFDFLCSFLRYYFQGDADFSVEPLNGMILSVLNDSPAHECAFSGNCGKHILCINYSDKLSACGRITDRNEFVYPIISGKIIEIVDVIKEQANRALHARISRMQCTSCRYFKMCHAGCSAYLDQNSIRFYCESIRKFWGFMNGEALILLKERLLKERKALLPLLDRDRKRERQITT